jgi:tRNA-dihydrouridine synthase B
MVGKRPAAEKIDYFLGDPLAIGPVEVPNRVVLAPMSGITDAPFRRLAERLGAGLVVSEMTACAGLARGEREPAVRSEGSGVGVHVVQLAGCVSAVRVPVTLKMRLGWDESTINAPALAQRAEAAGIKLITVHGRTRCQFFDGRADWRAVRRVKQAVAIPVVVNGDIHSCADAVQALVDSRADAVMIGRAVQGRPWLPGQIARYFATGAHSVTPSLAEQFDLIDALYEEMLNHHGLTIGPRHARKHLGWALNSAAVTAGASAELLKHHGNRVLTAEEPRSVRLMLAEAFDDFGRRAAA